MLIFLLFCNPGDRDTRKGGIEGEGGYFRRNHLIPVPRVADLDALNTMLLTASRADYGAAAFCDHPNQAQTQFLGPNMVGSREDVPIQL